MKDLQRFSIQIFLNRKGLFLLGMLLVIIVSIMSLVFGSVALSMDELMNGFMDTASLEHTILFNLRLPRLVGGILAGAALSAAGVLLQGVLNNALASPNVIGVNAGAGFALMLLFAFMPKLTAYAPLAAFLGAFITALLIVVIASKTGASRMTLVLSGVAVSSFLNAMMSALELLHLDLAVNVKVFMNGSLANIHFSQLAIPAFLIIISLIIVCLFSRSLNILMLGDETAASLGLNSKRLRWILLLFASLLSGSVVSYAGLIGFVGLIVPHFARKLVGNDNTVLLPFAILCGSIFTVLCDLAGRVFFTPYELPVGIVLAFIGSPFFLFLLIHQKGRRLHD